MENVLCPRGASRYTWREGDTLAALARRNATTEQAIRLANEGRDLDALSPGDELCVPPRPLTCVSGDEYIVRGGETFASIARAFDISTLELSERNPFVDPANLTPGDVLCVPKRGGTGGGTGTGGAIRFCPAGYRQGVVRYGETIEEIALRYNVSYQAIRQANPFLTPGRITPGQRFCVPPSGTRLLCNGGGRSYILEPGESLQSVSALFGVSQGRLLLLNPSLAPSDFIPGRVVCIG